EEATAPNIGPGRHARVNGTGQTPFVVGDGPQAFPEYSTPLVARRTGWVCTNKPAPAGVLARLDVAPSTPFGGAVCDAVPPPGVPECAASYPCPGDVVVPVMQGSAVGATWATQNAQRDATVYMKIGNGTSASVLTVGKTLVRVKPNVTINPGDIVVSSNTAGTAMANNSTSDPRAIIG